MLVEALRNPRLTFSRNLAFSGLVLVASLHPAAADHLRLGLCRHAAGSLRHRGAAARDPLSRRDGRRGLRRRSRCWPDSSSWYGSVAIRSAWRAPPTTSRRSSQALDHVPMGARVVTLRRAAVRRRRGRLLRNSHLGAMVMVRREGFSNDQWLMEGRQPARPQIYAAAAISPPTRRNIVRPNDCPRSAPSHHRRLARRGAARRLRLCLADRHRRRTTRAGRRHAAGLARARFYPLSSPSMMRFRSSSPASTRKRASTRCTSGWAPPRERRSARIMRSCWSTTARAIRAGRSCSGWRPSDPHVVADQPVAQPRPPAGADRRARPLPRRHHPDHRRRSPGPARAARRYAADDARATTPTWSTACARAAPAKPRSSARPRTASTACCRARPKSTSPSTPAISG